MMTIPSDECLRGSLLGTAVGDSVALPYEGISREGVVKRWPNQVSGRIEHRLVFRRGMVSDDTEHTVMILDAARRCPDDSNAFARRFGWAVRWWIISFPAGVGLATARAGVRLWLGFSTRRSGIHSAGNGPCMRSAILGVLFEHDPVRRKNYVEASARVTHRDPRAIEGALLVAEAASLACRSRRHPPLPSVQIIETLRGIAKEPIFIELLGEIESGVSQGWSLQQFAERIGAGSEVSGYAPISVAVAVYAWLRYRGDFEMAVSEIIRAGGDTDTVAAIAGGIIGSEVGVDGIPSRWLEGLLDWPLSVKALSKVAAGRKSVPLATWLVRIPRNLGFLVIVLGHGFRRLIP